MPQKPVTPATIRPAPTKAGTREKPGRHEQAQHRAEERKAAGADLHLPLQLDRLTAVGHDGEPRLLPGIETALDDEGLAASHPLSAASRAACPAVRAPLLQ